MTTAASTPFALAVLLMACSPSDPGAQEPPPHPTTTTATEASPPPTEAPPTPTAEAPDGPHAPIDCPLRAAGQAHDPTMGHPFDDTAAYIAFLDRPDRDTWQRPEAVIEALKLAGTETVVDVGAGSGYFAFRLAKALPAGRVDALDVQPEMVRHLHHTAMTEELPNLRASLIPSDAPRLDPDADIVFVCDVLHHVPAPDAWLKRVAAQMTSRARLALIEFSEGELPEGPPESAKIPRARLLELARLAGLELVDDRSELLPYQEFLLFRRTP